MDSERSVLGACHPAVFVCSVGCHAGACLGSALAPHSRDGLSASLPQVKYILGLKIDRSDTLQGNLEQIFSNLWQFK